MSAQWVSVDETVEPEERSPRRRLRPVAPGSPRLARFPFLLVLMGVFGLGMAGLLMLNTTLQNQAFQSRELTRQATELAYTQASLESQIDAAGAPTEIARQASLLGMRPNPYPAFLVVPSGKVLGEPQVVNGTEVPRLVIRTAAEKKAAREARDARIKAKQAKEAAEAKAAAKKAAEKKAAAKKKAAADEKEAAAKKAAAEKKEAAEKKAAAEKKKKQDERRSNG